MAEASVRFERCLQVDLAPRAWREVFFHGPLHESSRAMPKDLAFADWGSEQQYVGQTLANSPLAAFEQFCQIEIIESQ